MIAKCKHAPYNLLLTPVTLLNTGRGHLPLVTYGSNYAGQEPSVYTQQGVELLMIPP